MIPLLQLANISFDYEQRRVIEHLTLTINGGDCAALIGPNGVGKTTLLRIASGALSPASGDVLIEGRPLATMPRKQRARLIALVPQRLEMSFDFTVEQIVAQGRTPYLGLLRGAMREDRLAVDRALDLADVTHMRMRVFNELSGGERQRVKIAMGLAQQPKLLLLDEPTQNLDIGRQAELIDLLHHLRKQGITIFVSIHDLHLIEGNFSTVHLLDIERRLISGTPKQVLTPFNLAQAFRCSPGRHLLMTEKFAMQGSL